MKNYTIYFSLKLLNLYLVIIIITNKYWQIKLINELTARLVFIIRLYAFNKFLLTTPCISIGEVIDTLLFGRIGIICWVTKAD